MGDDLSISRISSGSKRQIRKIRKIVAHPNYSPMNLKHDIAMVFVSISEYFVVKLWTWLIWIINNNSIWYQLTSSFTVTDTFAPVQIANRSVVDFQACSIGMLAWITFLCVNFSNQKSFKEEVVPFYSIQLNLIGQKFFSWLLRTLFNFWWKNTNFHSKTIISIEKN